jgi:hypothetical protein
MSRGYPHFAGLLSLYPHKQATYWVHLKVDQFPTGQCNDHLSLVDGTLGDVLFAWRSPLVHTLVGPNVTNTFWVDLKDEIKKMNIMLFHTLYRGLDSCFMTVIKNVHLPDQKTTWTLGGERDNERAKSPRQPHK